MNPAVELSVFALAFLALMCAAFSGALFEKSKEEGIGLGLVLFGGASALVALAVALSHTG